MTLLLAVLLAFPPVVMYHRVDAASPDDAIGRRLTISPSQFADELQSLHHRGIRTIGIDELARDLAARRTPPHAVLLTFDDGYGDQFRYAFPILQRFGDRATFFVNTSTIGKPGHLTWSDLQAMSAAGMSIECHGVAHVDLASLGAAASRYQVDRCVASLQAHLRRPILAFAYPSGGFGAQTIEAEKNAGVLLGFTTDVRFQTDRFSPYQVARIRVLNGMPDGRFDALLARPPTYVDFSVP